MASAQGREMIHIPNRYNKPFDGSNADRHRRLVAVPVDLPTLWDLFETGVEFHKRCIKGLPRGARFIGTEDIGSSLSTYFIFEHESFDQVPTGRDIPVQPVVYEDVKE